MKELIAYEPWHDVMWLGGEDQEVGHQYKGPGCKREGQARGSGAMYRWGGEAWVDSLVPMDHGNGKEQAKLRSMN
jgi:hypothetical protein